MYLSTEQVRKEGRKEGGRKETNHTLTQMRSKEIAYKRSYMTLMQYKDPFEVCTFSRADNGYTVLKYKVKSDYLYKTKADILQNSEEGRRRSKQKRSRNTRICFKGSDTEELGL